MVEEIAPVVAGAAEAVIEAAEAAAEAHPVLEPVAEVVEEVGYLKPQILESLKKISWSFSKHCKLYIIIIL